MKSIKISINFSCYLISIINIKIIIVMKTFLSTLVSVFLLMISFIMLSLSVLHVLNLYSFEHVDSYLLIFVLTFLTGSFLLTLDIRRFYSEFDRIYKMQMLIESSSLTNEHFYKIFDLVKFNRDLLIVIDKHIKIDNKTLIVIQDSIGQIRDYQRALPEFIENAASGLIDIHDKILELQATSKNIESVVCKGEEVVTESVEEVVTEKEIKHIVSKVNNGCKTVTFKGIKCKVIEDANDSIDNCLKCKLAKYCGTDLNPNYLLCDNEDIHFE